MNEGPERTLAVFLDFENLALGFQKSTPKKKFEIHKVLERLVEKGKILVKKAYSDWGRFTPYKQPLHDAAFELIDIPKRSSTGKNSADIRLCVDAMDMCYSKEHIDTFVILSGDSDFSPLVSKLKENGKYVIGLATQGAASKLLIENCDEFIFYEELEQGATKPPSLTQKISKEKRPIFQLLIDSVSALMRENKDILHSSMVKQTMKRKRPDFNEGRYGYRAFGDMLEDAQKHGLIVLREDSRSGTYVVSGFGKVSTTI
ncbi:MAG: NYN domain-containing protein [Acidobacteriota bacterium]